MIKLFKNKEKEYKFDNPCYLCDVSIMNLGTGHLDRYVHYLSDKFNDFIIFDIFDKRFIIYCLRGENRCAREYFSDRYLCPSIIEKEILDINDNFPDSVMSSPFANHEWISDDDINSFKLYDQYRRIKKRRENLYKIV